MRSDLFAKVRLGYVLVESRRLDDWRRFGAEGLGLHVDVDGDGTLAFRIDDHERRLIVSPGRAEDVVALGFHLDDEPALDDVMARLRVCGISAQVGEGDDARRRGVERFVSFVGPKGRAIELYTRPLRSAQPLAMRASGFVTGASGMGHVAITTLEPTAMRAFWQNLFDARVSDTIEDRLDGVPMDFTFLHINERHHTVAIASARGVRMDPIRTMIHHLNLQAASLDDVTDAYVRCRQLGFKIANALGQHPNDRELSFYVVTPSGFEIELGWRPIVVPADRPWRPAHYQGISLWGHFPEGQGLGAKLRRGVCAVRSLRRREYKINTEPCRDHQP